MGTLQPLGKRGRPKPLADGIEPHAVGYIRVSTEEQGDSGLGLDAQRAKILRYCDSRAMVCDRIYREVQSGIAKERPELQAALDRLESGAANMLVVGSVDRLTRSVVQFSEILDMAHNEGWSLVLLDGGSGEPLNLSSPAGYMMAGLLGLFAEFERQIIGERTRVALAAAKTRGVALGRPLSYPPALVRRMRLLRSEGMSYHGMSKLFASEGVPCPRGGKWGSMKVWDALNRTYKRSPEYLAASKERAAKEAGEAEILARIEERTA